MARKYGILAPKRRFSDKHFANCDLSVPLALPGGIGHFDLVHVCEQRVHPIERCHVVSAELCIEILLHIFNLILTEPL